MSPELERKSDYCKSMVKLVKTGGSYTDLRILSIVKFRSLLSRKLKGAPSSFLGELVIELIQIDARAALLTEGAPFESVCARDG